MELKLITDQGGGSLEEHFSALVESSIFPDAAQKMLALARHLQRDIPGPLQWVTVSHKVLIYMGERDVWFPDSARVFVSPREYGSELGYEIKYRSARELDWEKSFTILEAHTVEEAGQMIVQALRLAEKDLKSRFDRFTAPAPEESSV